MEVIDDKATGFYVSVPQSQYDKIVNYAQKTKQRKSTVGQDALRAYLENTPEVNELARVALACQQNGINVKAVADDLRARLTKA